MNRTFEIKDAKPEARPLMLGLVGASSSGKTFSALRLATGLQRVYGGDIAYIDTESKRALHYSEMFKFKHLDFRPPFSPLDYIDAIETAVKSGAKVIVVDSMTHEHNGEGGVMDEADKWLDAKFGDNEYKRQANFGRALVIPKGKRRKLKNYLIQLGSEVAFIFCYRAKEGLDFKNKDSNGQLRQKGWEPETTSDLHYEMAMRFLLLPGCDGVPILTSDKIEEGHIIKNPHQFRGWFKDKQALSEEIGEKFGRWAKGNAETEAPKPAPAKPTPTPAQEPEFDFDGAKPTPKSEPPANEAPGVKAMRLIQAIQKCKTKAELEAYRDEVMALEPEMKAQVGPVYNEVNKHLKGAQS